MFAYPRTAVLLENIFSNKSKQWEMGTEDCHDFIGHSMYMFKDPFVWLFYCNINKWTATIDVHCWQDIMVYRLPELYKVAQGIQVCLFLYRLYNV